MRKDEGDHRAGAGTVVRAPRGRRIPGTYEAPRRAPVTPSYEELRGTTGDKRGTRPPTERQREFVAQVLAFSRAWGRLPTLRELTGSMDCGLGNLSQLAEKCIARGLLTKTPGGQVQVSTLGAHVAAGLDLVHATPAEYVGAALDALRRDLESPRPLRVTLEQRARLGVEGCYAELVDAVTAQAEAEWAMQRATARLGAA